MREYVSAEMLAETSSTTIARRVRGQRDDRLRVRVTRDEHGREDQRAERRGERDPDASVRRAAGRSAAGVGERDRRHRTFSSTSSTRSASASGVGARLGPGELLGVVGEAGVARSEQPREQPERAAAVGRRTPLGLAGERERALEARQRLGRLPPPVDRRRRRARERARPPRRAAPRGPRAAARAGRATRGTSPAAAPCRCEAAAASAQRRPASRGRCTSRTGHAAVVVPPSDASPSRGRSATRFAPDVARHRSSRQLPRAAYVTVCVPPRATRVTRGGAELRERREVLLDANGRVAAALSTVDGRRDGIAEVDGRWSSDACDARSRRRRRCRRSRRRARSRRRPPPRAPPPRSSRPRSTSPRPTAQPPQLGPLDERAVDRRTGRSCRARPGRDRATRARRARARRRASFRDRSARASRRERRTSSTRPLARVARSEPRRPRRPGSSAPRPGPGRRPARRPSRARRASSHVSGGGGARKSERTKTKVPVGRSLCRRPRNAHA